MATAWISVIGSAVTAIAAFGGVILAQRATRMRDLDGRIWESRSRAYEDLMRWILATRHAVDGMPADVSGQPPQLSEDQARALMPAPDLEARVTAYASGDILRDFRGCLMLLASASGRRDTARDVAGAARSLSDDIREELRTGRELRVPLAFRLQWEWLGLRSVPALAFGGRRALRGDRLMEQEDAPGFTWRSDVHGAADAQPGDPPP
jgi:hypothetical protein